MTLTRGLGRGLSWKKRTFFRKINVPFVMTSSARLYDRSRSWVKWDSELLEVGWKELLQRMLRVQLQGSGALDSCRQLISGDTDASYQG